ncbi:hypothetical protein TREAZ_1745 [Leadbettera azotonutricia ZAS-9]|uniref:Uncharacterized protein n=1 Tax=Leadbettera azotonutricia (strain ATCC BAA-888 / DSM 13862 / ZAS-9) TaxID=545695 RepID=F5YCK8_LEAAZ|nr:hypothetical protein TREAZ_1745 [Leadbettera azotonutricia ZAS-9]
MSILCFGASFREPLVLKSLGILLFSSGCFFQSILRYYYASPVSPGFPGRVESSMLMGVNTIGL